MCYAELVMYIKKSRAYIGGKTYEYLRLVQGVRVGSKIYHKVVAYLGRLDDPTSAAFFLFSKIPVDKSNLSAKLYALPMACNLIIEKILILPEILNRVFPPSTPKHISLLVKLMILSRIISPDSKLSLTRWYQHLYLPEKLPKSIDVHQFYTALDYLIASKTNIEQELFRRLVQEELIDTTVVFYDLTSSYFEGEDCEIAKFGHSLDRRSDCLQITIGLVIDKTGLPIFHEVFEGNMLDKKTVKGILTTLKERFHFSRVLFVADKGMLSPDNVEALEQLEKDGITYILSQSQRTGYELIKPALLQKETWTKLSDSLWYTKTEAGTILCYNPFTAKKATETRSRKLKTFSEYIPKELAKEHLGKRKQDKQTIHDRIIKKLNRSYMGKYFDSKNNFKKKDATIEKEELLDGVWVLTGNANLTPKETIEAYKQEAAIESSFRVIKDVVELRPIYHYNPNRVRAHVFICVLSYLVARILERKTGQTIKMLKEKYMTSVIINGDTPTSAKQIIGGSIPIKLD